MAGKYSSGKHAIAISDRSGLQFPYTEMVREWNGLWVHISEFESKQPQLELKVRGGDAQALEHARPQASLSHTGGVPDQLEPIFPPTIPSQYNGLGIITTNLLTSSLGSVTIVTT